jgi:hypothetical protein
MAIFGKLVYDAPANLCGQLVTEYLGTSGAAADEGARRQESGGRLWTGVRTDPGYFHNYCFRDTDFPDDEFPFA